MRGFFERLFRTIPKLPKTEFPTLVENTTVAPTPPAPTLREASQTGTIDLRITDDEDRTPVDERDRTWMEAAYEVHWFWSVAGQPITQGGHVVVHYPNEGGTRTFTMQDLEEYRVELAKRLGRR